MQTRSYIIFVYNNFIGNCKKINFILINTLLGSINKKAKIDKLSQPF